jgi:hypothetical protein
VDLQLIAAMRWWVGNLARISIRGIFWSFENNQSVLAKLEIRIRMAESNEKLVKPVLLVCFRYLAWIIL